MTNSNRFKWMIVLVLLSGLLMIPAVMATDLNVDDATFTDLGLEQTIAIKLAGVPAPYGFSGCAIELELQDPLVEIISVKYRPWGTLFLTSSLPSSNGCYLLAADTQNQVGTGVTGVYIADIKMRSLATGTTKLLVTSYEIKDDNGYPIPITVKGGEITITVPDTTPPGPVTNLQHAATLDSITWTWVNPTDTDFHHINYQVVDSTTVDTGNLGKNQLYDTMTKLGPLAPGTTLTIKIRTVDALGNKGPWVTDTATTLLPDTTPPGPVTNLQHTTTQNSITWAWVNPTDADFDHIMYKISDGATVLASGKLSKTETSYIVDSLTTGDVRKIEIRTVDTSDNKGTWVSDTATAQATQQGTGTLEITTRPRGATVEIAGVYYGLTSGRFTVPAGNQEVTLTLDGVPVKKMVYIPLNGYARLTVIF
jgi:hypothetical protein